MRHERRAGRLALPGHDVQHPGRQDVLGDLREAQCGEGRELGGLEHHRVPRRQRGTELPRRHVERVVPRRDRRHDTDRVAAEERRVVLHVLTGGPAFHEAGTGREEPPVVDGEVHLELDDRTRLPDVADLEILDRLHVVRDRVGDLAQHLEPDAGRRAGPRLERLRRGADRLVDVFPVAGGDLVEQLAGRRVAHLVGLSGLRRPPGTADVVLARHDAFPVVLGVAADRGVPPCCHDVGGPTPVQARESVPKHCVHDDFLARTPARVRTCPTGDGRA